MYSLSVFWKNVGYYVSIIQWFKTRDGGFNLFTYKCFDMDYVPPLTDQIKKTNLKGTGQMGEHDKRVKNRVRVLICTQSP